MENFIETYQKIYIIINYHDHHINHSISTDSM